MNALENEERYRRMIAALIAVLAGCVLIRALSLALPFPAPGSGKMQLSAILPDRGSSAFPVTIQNAMWMMYCFGLGELWIRFRRAKAETEQFGSGFRPPTRQRCCGPRTQSRSIECDEAKLWSMLSVAPADPSGGAAVPDQQVH